MTRGSQRYAASLARPSSGLARPARTSAVRVSALKELAQLMHEFADLIASVGDAVNDGRVSPNELTRVEKEWAEVVAAGQCLVRDLRAEVQARKDRMAAQGLL